MPKEIDPKAVFERLFGSSSKNEAANAKIRRDASFDLDRVNEYLAITHHDVTAFLRSVADSLGEEGRYVHFGLTSSDVWDTATAGAVIVRSGKSGLVAEAFRTREVRVVKR